WMSHEGVFKSDRADPLAARLDKILRSVAQGYGARRRDRDDVARSHPSVRGKGFGSCAISVICGRDVRTSNFQLTHSDPVPRNQTVFVARPYFNERLRNPLTR